MTISADGRYVISSDEEGMNVRVYELPLRRSLFFIAVAGGAWTTLAFIVPWWRRRRGSEENPSSELCTLSK
jgi:hypothetical protein